MLLEVAESYATHAVPTEMRYPVPC